MNNKNIQMNKSYIIGIAKNKIKDYYRFNYKVKITSLFSNIKDNKNIDLVDTIDANIDIEKIVINKHDINLVWQYLLKKDKEELEEVKSASTKDEIKKELADKLEILISMAEFNGFTLEDVIYYAKVKREKNGDFQKRILLEKVIELD